MKIVRKHSETSILKRNKKLFITLKFYFKNTPLFQYLHTVVFVTSSVIQNSKGVYYDFIDANYKYKNTPV